MNALSTETLTKCVVQAFPVGRTDLHVAVAHPMLSEAHGHLKTAAAVAASAVILIIGVIQMLLENNPLKT